jgi:predicted ATP-dependent endonuclease of OLD family
LKADKLIIQNFRSFGAEPTIINLSDGLTGLIGANSSGKTAIMAALTRLFGPTNFDRIFVKSDFHAPAVAEGEEKVSEAELSIEVIFSFAEGNGSIPPLFDDMTVNAPGQPPILPLCSVTP